VNASLSDGTELNISASHVIVLGIAFNGGTFYLTKGAMVDFETAVNLNSIYVGKTFISADAGCRVTGKITTDYEDATIYGVHDYAAVQGVVFRTGRNEGYKDITEWRVPERVRTDRFYIGDDLAASGAYKIYNLEGLDIFKDMSRVISIRVIRSNTMTAAGNYATFEIIKDVTGWLYPKGEGEGSGPDDCIGFYNWAGWDNFSDVSIFVTYLDY
jgi:hypothetical protein